MITAQDLIEAENYVKEMWEAGDVPYLTHLCGGNEQQLIDIFKRINHGDWIFVSHRAHYHYLLTGLIGIPSQPWEREQEAWNSRVASLFAQIRAGDSMFLYDKEQNFVASAIVAGNCCIAAGVALQLKRAGSANKVWCFVGDGAEDQGHFYEAVRFVDHHRLPCTFIIEDNDQSCSTPKRLRMGEYIWPHPTSVYRYRYTPTYPHAGSGCKHHIEFKKL